MDAGIGRQPPESPEATCRRSGDHEVGSEQTDSGTATEFVETDAARSVDPTQYEVDGTITFQTFDLSQTEPRVEELLDAGDTVLVDEVLVGGSGEMSHGGPFPYQNDSRGKSVLGRLSIASNSPRAMSETRRSGVFAHRLGDFRAEMSEALRRQHFSTNASSWRRLRHSYTPSLCVPYSPTIESPVSQ